MYRQVFTSPTDNLVIPIPQSWYGKKIEVIAFPVNEVLDVRASLALPSSRVIKNRKKREENSKKYSVSFGSLGYQFNREEANNYDETSL